MSPIVALNEGALQKLLELPVGSWSAADLSLAREGLGMTQADLAAAIGYDRSAIAKIEGGDVAPRLVVELAVRYLVGGRPQGHKFQAKAPPNVSRFRPSGAAIGVSETGFPGSAAVEVHLAEGPVVWFRLMPEFDSGRRFSSVQIKKTATQNEFPLVQLMNGYSSLGFVRGADGFGVFGITGDRSNTTSVSFVFETGEIWGVDSYVIEAVKQHARSANQQFGMPYFEDRFKYAAHWFRLLLNRLELRYPLRWIAGIEGVQDAGLYYPARSGHYFPIPAPHGRSLVDVIWGTGTMSESDTAASALKPFFEKLFNTFGLERPEYLDDLSNPQ